LLEKETGMEQRNARHARKGLVSRGLLVIERIGVTVGKSTCVRLVMPADAQTAGAPGRSREPRGYRRPPLGGAGDPMRGVKRTPSGGCRQPPELPRTLHEHHKKAPADAGGDVGGFSAAETTPPAADPAVLAFLRDRCKLNLHPRLVAAAGGLSLEAVRALWKQTVNAHPQGQRQGPMAQAVMDGSWKVAAARLAA
jgi:hypothetical protein